MAIARPVPFAPAPLGADWSSGCSRERELVDWSATGDFTRCSVCEVVSDTESARTTPAVIIETISSTISAMRLPIHKP